MASCSWVAEDKFVVLSNGNEESVEPDVLLYDTNGTLYNSVLAQFPTAKTALLENHTILPNSSSCHLNLAGGVGALAFLSQQNLFILPFNKNSYPYRLFSACTSTDSAIVPISLTSSTARKKFFPLTHWSPDGSFLAVISSANEVSFFSCTGELLSSISIPPPKTSPSSSPCCLTWCFGGTMLAVAQGSQIVFLATRYSHDIHPLSQSSLVLTRPFGGVLASETAGAASDGRSCAIFINLHTFDSKITPLPGYLTSSSSSKYFVVSTINITSSGQSDSLPGLEFDDDVTKGAFISQASHQYFLSLYNSIGAQINSAELLILPRLVACTDTFAVATDGSAVCLWCFDDTVRRNFSLHYLLVDDPSFTLHDFEKFSKINASPSADSICYICTSKSWLGFVRQSGRMTLLSRSDFSFIQTVNLAACANSLDFESITKMVFNNIESRLAVIDKNYRLVFFIVKKSSSGLTFEEIPDVSRKDVWTITYALDDPDLALFGEKSKVFLSRDGKPEDPMVFETVTMPFFFNDLEISSLCIEHLLDSLVPSHSAICFESESKPLRDLRQMTSTVSPD
ncbi:hypothetical protein GEMRC1_002326 [Eukaryota sp. GEM-RC1]